MRINSAQYNFPIVVCVNAQEAEKGCLVGIMIRSRNGPHDGFARGCKALPYGRRNNVSERV